MFDIASSKPCHNVSLLLVRTVLGSRRDTGEIILGRALTAEISLISRSLSRSKKD